MKLKMIVAAAVAALASAFTQSPPQRQRGRFVGRFRFADVAFGYRMGAGFPGDVNRTHPASIIPGLIDEDDPATLYGMMTVIDTVTNAHRKIVAADQSDAVPLTPSGGALVRPFPGQQVTATNYGGIGFGMGTPPTTGPADFCNAGYIMVQLNAGVAAPTKGGRVYIWAAATAGDHVQGGYETQFSAGNTVLLDARYLYNGPPDAAGVAELACNV